MLIILATLALGACGGGGDEPSRSEAQKAFKYWRTNARVVDDAVKGSADQRGRYLADLEHAERHLATTWKKSPGYVHDVYRGYYKVTRDSLDKYIASARTIVSMRAHQGDFITIKRLLKRAIVLKEQGRRLYNRGVDRWNAALKDEVQYLQDL